MDSKTGIIALLILLTVMAAILASIWVADRLAEAAQSQAVIAQQQTAQTRIVEDAKTERFQTFALALAAISAATPGAASPIAPLSGIVMLAILFWYLWRKDRRE